eukprot:7029247-Karenia_brevis.AAC.1
MLFHARDDDAVRCCDGKLSVDDTDIDLFIYGTRIEAVTEFKYLGVVLDEFGSASGHLAERIGKSKKAISALIVGLARIPGYSFGFLCYLWNTLVAPVLLYGCEAYLQHAADSQQIMHLEIFAWRRLFQVGGRTPIDAILCLRGLVPLHIEMRVRRVGFLLRLMNSAVVSWQHAALIIHVCLGTPWFLQAMADLRIIMPSLRIQICESHDGPFVSSSGFWSDEGVWVSAVASTLPLDELGRRRRRTAARSKDDIQEKAIQKHIKFNTARLRSALVKEFQSEVFWKVYGQQFHADESKMKMLAVKLVSPGPPLHIGLAWVTRALHRSAIAALFTGDLFLGRYASNYFARNLLPK